MHATKLAVMLVASVFIAGCARINPAFGDEEAGLDSAGSTRGTATTSPGSMTTTDSGGQGTGVAVTGGSSGPLPSDASGDTAESAEGSSTGVGETCEPLPDAAARFEVLLGDNVVPPPANCETVLELSVGTMQVEEGDIYQHACEACMCTVLGGHVVNFVGDVDLPTLPTCGSLLLWPGYGADGDCRWDGVAVFAGNQPAIPEFFFLNSRNFPATRFGDVLVDFDGESDCLNPGQCVQSPGSYDLRFFNGDIASVGEMTEVEIDFSAPASFRVHNRMSSVDVACAEHVAWTGLQM